MEIRFTSVFLQLLVVMCCLCINNCQKTTEADVTVLSSEPTTEISQNLFARQYWMKADKDLKMIVGSLVKKAMPFVLREVYKKDLSSSCLTGLIQFVSAFKQSKLWAYQMLDSSGRFPEGFLSGTLTALGNYDECIEIDVNETKVKLQGQYCQIELIPPLPKWQPFTSLHLRVKDFLNISKPGTVIDFLTGFIQDLYVTSIKIGICTPSVCTKEDVYKLVQILPDKIGKYWKFEVIGCEGKQELHFTQPQIIILYTFGVLLILTLFGTIIDKLWNYELVEQSSAKAKMYNIAKSFSLTSNAKKLSDFVPEKNLQFICGMIFLIFIWNVLANSFIYVNYDTAANILDAFRILKHLFFEIALNRVFPIQILFFLSGFIITYEWLKSPEKNLNIWKFLLKRYWRFTPPYLLALCFVMMMPTFGSGPSWNRHMNFIYDNCQSNWWYNILYINNFLYGNKACLDHLWVFAVDAQLCLIGICILIPLKQRPKIGLLVTLVLAIGSLVSVALTNVYYDLPPNEMSAYLNQKDRMFYAEHSYFRVYTHMSMYCAGVFVAYLLVKHPDLKISKKTSAFFWIVTGVAISAALSTVHQWREGEMPSPLTGALYSTFSRVGEAAFLSWLVVACIKGHAGIIKDVLSWRPFAFFARLSFLAYIVHVPIIVVIMSFKKTHLFIAETEILYLILSHFGGSYILAYFLYLFFDAPFISLADVARKCTKEKTFNTSASSSHELISEKPFKYSDKIKFEANNKFYLNAFNKDKC